MHRLLQPWMTVRYVAWGHVIDHLMRNFEERTLCGRSTTVAGRWREYKEARWISSATMCQLCMLGAIKIGVMKDVRHAA